MPLKNTPDRYGFVTKMFHWIMAILIIMMLVMGLVMEDIEVLADKLWVYNLHKSLGVTILALATLRVIWHLISKTPAFVGGLKDWEKCAAKAVHYFLYFAMFAMPLSGWLMSSAGGRPVSVFGLFTLPDLIEASKDMRHLTGDVHEYIAYALIAAIGAHFGAALKHHFIAKDRTLRRMLPFGVLVLALFLALPTHAASVTKWDIDKTQSTLGFAGKQMGTDFSGQFKTFDADITFDTDNLAASSVTATIEMGSVDSDDSERDGNLKGAEFFNVAQFPTARFESKTFEKTETGYVAKGTLTIGEITAPLDVTFALDITAQDSGKKTAVMTGTATLDRSIWKVGTGDWADPSVIANAISIQIHLIATTR